MQEFKNILSQFKNNSDDFKWVARPIEFMNSYNQARPKVSPSVLKYLVSKDKHLLQVLKELSEQSKLKPHYSKIVTNILDEIGYKYDLSVIRWLGYILLKVLRKSLSAIYVNENKLLKIKSELGDSPVIFLPTHRSYGDFILMAFLCFYYEISIPCVAAGMDFHSMQIMNEVLRRCKAFYMRRTFSNDPIYTAIFKEYIKAIITYEDCPVEFFIEGTRSRTGKTLMPKFGLLSMFIDAYLSGSIPDLKIVPINISYDRVLEETLFARELLGIPKTKESTKGLLKALRNLNEDYGKIFISFGDPLSIRSFFSLEQDPRFWSDVHKATKIEEVAFEIIRKQQKLQAFGCFNLLSLIIYDAIISKKSNCVALNDVIDNFKWLLDLFEKCDANVYIEVGNIENAIRESVAVHSTLVELTDDNFLCLKINKELAWFTEKEFLSAVPVIMLQCYINPSVSLFIKSSVITTILKRLAGENGIAEGLLYENYKWMRYLLRYEFPFNDTDSYKEFHYGLSELKNLDVIDITQTAIRLKQYFNKINFLHNLIQPFLTGIHATCTFLKENEILNRTKADILKMVQAYIKGKMREGLELYHYCLSIDLISNSFNSLFSVRVITQRTMDNNYIVDMQLLDKVLNFLTMFIPQNDNMDYAFIQKKFDVKAKL